MFLIDDYVVFVIVVVVVVLFVVDVAASEFDVVVSAAVVVFHLVVVIVLFVVAAVVSDFEIDSGDSAVAWDFFEVFVNYFGDLDDVVESCRSCGFSLRLVIASDATVWVSIRDFY